MFVPSSRPAGYRASVAASTDTLGIDMEGTASRWAVAWKKVGECKGGEEGKSQTTIRIWGFKLPH